MIKKDTPTVIAIGTQNRAKTEGVELAFGKVFEHVETHGFSVESGISEQPMTDEESINGAINRAKSALARMATAHYGVGLEGNVTTISEMMFLHGWAAIVDRTGKVGLGHSSGIELPGSMHVALDAGAELGPLMQDMLDDADNEIRHTLGTNGVLTGGLYTRVDEFADATTAALAKFVKPELYR